MLTLALDTSGDVCSVAVTTGPTLWAEYFFRHERRLTERLPGIVEFVLKDAGVTLPEIEVFAVGLGPGSFTGVRVGVTMAKVWAEVFQKPLFGISSLDAVLLDVPALSGERCAHIAVVPSRKDEVIATICAFPGQIRVLEPTVLPTADVARRARELCGEDVRLLVVGECARWIPPTDGLDYLVASPRASSVAVLARTHDAWGRDPDDPATLSPLYVAPPPIRGKLSPSV